MKSKSHNHWLFISIKMMMNSLERRGNTLSACVVIVVVEWVGLYLFLLCTASYNKLRDLKQHSYYFSFSGSGFCTGSHKVTIKVSAGAAVLSEVRLGKEPLLLAVFSTSEA